ncbi:MAG TPA: hypothetical protein VER33_15045 [Polyangiaceae bacterium]|nr:hypothetical protein [Polyangiaceae bacterium]
MNIPPDLIELLSAFAATSVRYLLVGGHAVAAHGQPRSTKDIDLWLAPGPDNIERACAALTAFGVPPQIVDALRSATPEDIVWLGRPPTRVDLLQTLPALEFEEVWPRRLVISLNGVSVPVLGKDDLIRNKQAVGRPQDRRDVRLLLGQPARKARPKKLP